MTKKPNVLAGCVAAGLLVSTGVQAQFFTPGELFRINLTGAPLTGAETPGILNDGVTGTIRELGYSGNLATSVYDSPDMAGIVNGTKVWDSNIDSILQTFGIAAGTNNYNRPVPPGGTVALNGSPQAYPDGPLDVNYDSLNQLQPPIDNEGFTGGFPNLAPITGQWGLLFDYYLEGVVSIAEGGVKYQDGYFDIFYYTTYSTTSGSSASDRVQVAHINVLDSLLEAPSLYLLGEIDYDADDNGMDDPWVTPFAKNFFVDVETGLTYYELWDGAALPKHLGVQWQLDTNVDPALPAPTQLGEISGTDPDGNVGDRLARQTQLDGSNIFRKNVPEPATLALVGLGLLGAGRARMRRRAA